MAKVLIAGYGSAGQYLVDFLLKDHRINNIDEIHIMSRKDKDEVEPRLDISRVAAGISERFIPLIYHCADFNNIDQMASIIEEVKPEIIVYTGRFAAGLKYGAFSYPHDIGYGVWMPLAAPYIYNLMKAVKQTSVSPKVINTSFPDGTNYLLKGEDLAPTCGAGNLNHLIPRIRRSLVEIINEREESLSPFSRHYKNMSHTTVNDFDIKLVGSHYLNTYVSKEGKDRGCPSYLYYERSDENYAYRIEGKLLQDVYRRSKDQSASGQIRNQMIATDCAEIVRLMLEGGRNEIIHIPGVDGEPGGYPVYFNDNGFHRITLYRTGLSLEDARLANLEGLRRDGVVIDKNRIYFTEEVRSKMLDIYQIDYPESISLPECEEFAYEISEVLRGITNKGKGKEVQ